MARIDLPARRTLFDRITVASMRNCTHVAKQPANCPRLPLLGPGPDQQQVT